MKAWTIDEVKQLLTVVRKNDPQFYVLLLIAICHGLRVSEVCTLRKRDFIIIGGEMKLRVARLKGSLETEQSLHHDADPLLDEDLIVRRYIAKIGNDDLLFTMKDGTSMSRFHADREVKKFCAVAGIDSSRAHMHCAKHSLGVLMRKAGRPISDPIVTPTTQQTACPDCLSPIAYRHGIFLRGADLGWARVRPLFGKHQIAQETDAPNEV